MPGIHTYNIPDAADQFVSRSDNPADKFIDSLDATAALHLAQRAMASEDEKQAADQFQIDQRVFRKMYPAYRDTAHNAKVLKHHWESVLGTNIPTLSQMEESFFACRQSGVMQLDATEVRKEDQQFIAARVEQIKAERAANEFNEADAYSMPLEELERRARGF